jgi:hypothetical protein
MTVTAKRWNGHCYECKRPREVENRSTHGEKALCDSCAERPHRPPSASGLDVEVSKSNGKTGVEAKGRYDGRILDVRAMLAQPDEPIPWRCGNLAADGFLSVLAGKGGEGKSWLALTLACGVARGATAAGIPCTKGKSVLFDAENGQKLTIRRFRAAEVADLAVQPVDAGGLRITSDIAWFKSTIEDHQAKFVVFDSLRVLSSGAKENDGDVMEPIITALKQLARDTGAAVLLIHHRGKSELSDYRGTSTILDQTDLMFRLERVKSDPEGRTRRKITTLKCRIDEEPEPRWVQITTDRARGLVTVDAAEPFEEHSRPRDALRERVLGVLTGISQPQARIARLVDRDAKDQSVRRVLKDLEDDGLAVRRPDGWGVSTGAPLGFDTPDTPTKNGSVEPSLGVSPELTPDTVERWTCAQCGGLLIVDEDARETRCTNGHRQGPRP